MSKIVKTGRKGVKAEDIREVSSPARISNSVDKKIAASSGAVAMDDLTDVTVTTPADGEVLTYNGTSSQWESTAAAGGGGGLEQEVTLVLDATQTAALTTSVQILPVTTGSVHVVDSVYLRETGGGSLSGPVAFSLEYDTNPFGPSITLAGSMPSINDGKMEKLGPFSENGVGLSVSSKLSAKISAANFSFDYALSIKIVYKTIALP